MQTRIHEEIEKGTKTLGRLNGLKAQVGTCFLAKKNGDHKAMDEMPFVMSC